MRIVCSNCCSDKLCPSCEKRIKDVADLLPESSRQRALAQARPSISIHQALDYEVLSAILVRFVTWGWLRRILAKRLARRTKRKYRRYLIGMRIREQLRNRGQGDDKQSRR